MDKKGKEKIEVLELLRFVAMTEVFLIHYMNDYILSGDGWKYPIVSGKLGVAFFFMITAYLLVKTTKVDVQSKKFFSKKCLQLLPKYEIILMLIFVSSFIVSSLFRTFDVSVCNFIKSIFLFPYITPGVPFSCPLLPVAWTLIVQIFVYILYWVIVKVVRDNNKAAIISSAFLILLYGFGNVMGKSSLFTFTYCRFYMLYFVAGFMTAVIEKNFFRIKSVGAFILHLPICILILSAFLGFSCIYEETIVFFLTCFICFVFVLYFGRRVKLPSCILFLGKISYSFFLIHYLICKAFTRIVRTPRNLFLVLLLMIMAYSLTVLIAWVYDSFIDKLVFELKKVGVKNG